MKARILVIEDEMSINDLLCMNLEIAGYETVGYLDGNEAYEAIIQDHAFQCALVDIMLDRLWADDLEVEDRIVDSHIKNIRKKLNADYIKTIRGVGYRIDKVH